MYEICFNEMQESRELIMHTSINMYTECKGCVGGWSIGEHDSREAC